MIENDDISAGVALGQQQLSQEQAAAEMIERVRLLQETNAKPSMPAPAADLDTQPALPEDDDQGFWDKAGSAARDIAMGTTIELPRSLAHGAIAGVNEGLQSIWQLGDWLRKKNIFPEGYLEFFGPDGIVSWKSEGTPPTPQLPNIDAPSSTTGKLISDIAQWTEGMILAGKAKPLQALAKTGKAGAVASAVGRGTVADFAFMDEAGPHLTDLVQQVPALANPLTEYLSGSPNDSALESRMKNALEGAGLGVMTEGVMHGLKALRGLRKAKRAGGNDQIEEAVKEFKTRHESVREQYREFKSKMGDPEGPAFVGEDKIRQAEGDIEAARGIKGQKQITSAKEGEGTYINWGRINSSDDVKTVMQNMADKFKGRIDEARRGVMTFKEISDASQAEDAWKILMERRKGQPLNAEQSLAARNLWTASADKLMQLAKEVQANPSEVNMLALRKQLVTHAAIQTEVIAARTETARALASWRIPSEATNFDPSMFSRILAQEGGGRGVTQDLAEKIVKLGMTGDLPGLARFAEKSLYAKTKDAVLDAWVSALLSNPKTHIVNSASNMLVLGQQMIERRVAEGISKTIGQGDVGAGEALAMLHGISSGWRDALAYAGKTLKTGQTGFGSGKVELPRQGAISAEAFGLSQDTLLGRAGGALANAVGAIVGIPGRALATADEFFKTIGSRMELHALAHRQTMTELSSGKITKDQVKTRYAELLDNPPDYAKAASQKFADYATFTNDPGKLANTISQLASQFAPIKILLPFVRTPANIMKYVLERSPGAPLMDTFRADIMAGGARRDIALARMGLGSFTLFAGADMAMSGLITGAGPKDKAQKAALRRTGWQPYSLHIGDKYFAFNRMDPVGAQLGFAADLGETLANSGDSEVDDTELEDLIMTGVFSSASNMLSKTYLSGLTSFFEMMGDPDRYSESWLKRVTGSLVPAGVAQATRSIDPTMREAQSILDSVRARTPGLSDNLPPVRDLWGRPVSYQSGAGWAYDAFSPVAFSQYKPEPIDSEILRLGATVNKPSKRVQFDGVAIDLTKYKGAYSRYVELAGNEAKDPAWNMGAKDFLNAVVTGKHPLSQLYRMYRDDPETGKAAFIKSTMIEYRERARDQLLREFPELAEDVKSKKEAMSMLQFAAGGM